jgi:F420-dependent oxidoreductase-like protein
MALRLGVHTGQQNITMQELRKLWRFIDGAGFDWISVWDHFYEAPSTDGNTPCFEAIAAMSALAVETQTVRVGCLVFCMNYRNPGLLANSLMTIDHLSSGRLEVGLGAGWHVAEHAAYGYPFDGVKERLDRLEEGTQALRLLFTQEQTDFEGRYYRLQDAKLYPRPVQARIPIIVGGRGERRTLRIAARHADGWNAAYVTAEEFGRLSGILDEWCEREGRDPATIDRTVNIHMHMGADTADAKRILEARAGTAAGGALTGAPKDAIEQLQAYQAAGATRVNIAIRPPVEWDALHAFAEEVIPAFSD